MIESYEPPADVRRIEDIEDRLRRLVEEWDRHGEELHRLHPEIEAEALRGPVPTPWQTKRH